MAEINGYPYIGVPQEDGNIRIEGPLSEDNFKAKLKAEEGAAVGTRAKSKGAAILKVISVLINSERSKT
jgi:hypothetical protein